jgi:hypothetical protein
LTASGTDEQPAKVIIAASSAAMVWARRKSLSSVIILSRSRLDRRDSINTFYQRTQWHSAAFLLIAPSHGAKTMQNAKNEI